MQDVDFEEVGSADGFAAFGQVDEVLRVEVVAGCEWEVSLPGVAGSFPEVETPFDIQTCHLGTTSSSSGTTERVAVGQLLTREAGDGFGGNGKSSDTAVIWRGGKVRSGKVNSSRQRRWRRSDIRGEVYHLVV